MPDLSNLPAPTSRLGKVVDRQIARLGELLTDPVSRRSVVVRVGRLLRCLVGLVAWPVLVAVPGLLVFTRWAGELHALTAFLLFLPPAVWVVVPAFVVLPALVFRWKLGVALTVFLALSPWAVFGWSPWPAGGENRAEAAGGGTVTVLTYNAGQSGPVPLKEFLSEAGADVIAMQDTYVYFHEHKMGKSYAPPERPDYPHLHRYREFVLYSKFPILSSTPVSIQGANRPEVVAVRHLLDSGSGEIVLYNVHLPTPRNLLRKASPASLALGYFGPDDTGVSAREQQELLENGWDAQCDAALSLLTRIAEETLPTVAAGDFNFPRYGYLARYFQETLDEARPPHGTGYTFPGTTRNPLSLGRPWMRLDHLFAVRGTAVPGAAVTETGRRSQHLATAATFRFQ